MELYKAPKGRYIVEAFLLRNWAIGLVVVVLALFAPHHATAQDCPGLAEDPVFIGRYDTPYQAVSSVVWGTIAYVADDWAGSLEILDVSDPSNPTLLGSYTPPDGPRDVVVIGTRVYLACAGAGLVILSAIDPTNPWASFSLVDCPARAHEVTTLKTSTSRRARDTWDEMCDLAMTGSLVAVTPSVPL